MQESARCPNCGCQISGRYCSDCGQQQNLSGSSLKQVGIEFFKEISDTDSRLLHSLTTLLLHPGQISADYLAQRRARYLPPFRLYLLINLALLFGLSWLSGTATVSLNVDIDVLNARTNADAARELASTLIPQIGFVLLPWAAMILKLLYLPRKMPFGDHFVAALHIKAAVALILCLAVALHGLVSGARVLSDNLIPQFGYILLLIAALVSFIHIGFSLQRIYGGRLILTALRLLLLLLMYCLFAPVVILAFLVISALIMPTV